MQERRARCDAWLPVVCSRVRWLDRSGIRTEALALVQGLRKEGDQVKKKAPQKQKKTGPKQAEQKRQAGPRTGRGLKKNGSQDGTKY